MEDKEILLVDDEEGIQRVLGIALKDMGYQVWTASSGDEALSVLERARPSIVLTDIKMPGMDGIALLRRIKDLYPETEVIMITGHGDLDLAVKSLQYEAADFIPKPIDDDALEIALKRVHERIWMKRALREYTERLERLVEEKSRKLIEAERLAAIGQTVAAIAHAVKNIIGGLKGGMFIMEKGLELKNENYRSQGWQMVKGNVEKIKNLALDLLNYAKEREPDYELCDPNVLAHEVCGLMRTRASECGVELEMDLSKDLKPLLLDPEGIHCCLVNLVTNAIDACANGINKPRKVVVRSKRDGVWPVEYEVADNGCGMDDDVRENLFRTFFSTKGSRGTGLGLMITRKIVAEHGGEIEVRTELGKGSRFIVKLPGVKKPSPKQEEA